MPKFIYEGPVLEFGTCVADNWRGETVAPSENKARSNLTYQYKKSHNKMPATKISLTGKIVEIN